MRKKYTSLFLFLVLIMNILSFLSVEAKTDDYIGYGGGVSSLAFTSNEHIVTDLASDNIAVAYIGKDGDSSFVNFKFYTPILGFWFEVPIRNSAYQSNHVAIARDSDFNIHAIYIEQSENGYYYLFYKVFDWNEKKWYDSLGGSLSNWNVNGYNLSSSGYVTGYSQDIKVDLVGNIHIMTNVVHNVDGDSKLVYYKFDGVSLVWDSPLYIETEVSSAHIYQYHSIALDSDSNIYCTYAKNQEEHYGTSFYDIWFTRSVDSGVSWSVPSLVVNKTYPYTSNPRKLIIDNSDILYLSYSYNDSDTQNFKINISRTNDLGATWLHYIAVTEGSKHSTNPSIAFDLNNVMYCTYTQKPSFGSLTYEYNIYGKTIKSGVLGDEVRITSGDLALEGYLNLVYSNTYNQYSNSGIYGIYEDRENANFELRYLTMPESDFRGAGGDQTVYINVLDGGTSSVMNVYGMETFFFPTLVANDPSVRLNLRGDLWIGEYSSGEYNNPMQLDLNFTDGSYHWLNFTDMIGYVEGVSKSYVDINQNIQLFDGQTYTIILQETIPYEGYSNCKTGETGGGLINQICTDKTNYVQGESINIRYKAMDPTSIIEHLYGFPYSGYQLWIYDRTDLGWWWHTDGGQSASIKWDVTQDNGYHYLHWDYEGEEGYGDITGGLNGYKMFIAKPYGGLFGSDVFLVDGPDFWISTGDFDSHGNITSISPSEPMLGQFVTIGFEANNDGYLTVKNQLAPEGQEVQLTSFMKFAGIETISKQFWEFGSYELNLYVNDGTGVNKVDTDYFDITDVNGSFGDFGFGIEFLTVEPERVVAGYDTVFVNYRSLDETGKIKIIDARYQTTSYGAVVGEKRGVLNISLPLYAAIGEWNITLTTANNTLYSSFNVVATENNWVEFNKNVFYENEGFELKLKHDKKVEIVFSKNDVEMGKDWFLEVDQLIGGIYPVPGDIIQLSPGSWKVEMYEVNNFIKIRLLAEDTCIVVEVPAGDLTEGGTGDIFQILTSGAGSIAEGEFGLAFMAIIFILVVVVSLAQLKLKNDTIFFGAILMALFMVFIGWLPVWIVVLSIVIAGFLFSSAFSKKLGIGA